MVVVPYYNKPTQEGLFRHFVEVARACACPSSSTTSPGARSSTSLPETLARICEAAPNVVAIKEATGNVLRAQKIVQTLGERLAVLCGDDALTLPMIAVRRARRHQRDLERAAGGGRRAPPGSRSRDRIDEARRAHLALLPVHEAMFVEANPAPVKAALALRGIANDVGAVADRARHRSRARVAIAAALEAYARGAR